MKQAFLAAGKVVEVIAPRQGFISADNGGQVAVDKSFLTTSPVVYDAVYVPGGTNSIATLEAGAEAIYFLNEVFKRCKASAAHPQAFQVLEATYFRKKLPSEFTNEIILREGINIGNAINALWM